MLEIGDMVLVTEEDIDFFLIGQVLILKRHDVGERYPHLVEYGDDLFWVENVIKATPLVKALL